MPAPTDICTRAAAAGALALLVCGFADAEPPRWPDAKDMAQALQAHPFPSAERLGAAPAPVPPTVQLPPATPPTDLEALARAGESLATPLAAATDASPLRIYITLAMPRASLQLLTEQAARSGAVLVLRGLKANSMRETIAAVASLIGERKVAWLIDPEAFTRYGIERAPTFVLSLGAHPAPGVSCGSTCRAEEAFLSVAGDVSLDHALETLARQRPEAEARIAPLRERLRGP